MQSELSNFAGAVESNMRFMAMMAGPFYPILSIVGERYVESNSFQTLRNYFPV